MPLPLGAQQGDLLSVSWNVVNRKVKALGKIEKMIRIGPNRSRDNR